MANLKDRRKADGFGESTPSPIEIYLTWNPSRGAWSYSLPQAGTWERGDMKNIRAVVLNPRLYRVTGRKDDDRISSNLCESFRSDLLTVRRKGLSGRSTKINESPDVWPAISAAVKERGGRYTKVIAVHLLHAKKAIYDGASGKLGQFKAYPCSHLAFLYLTGNAILKGWGASIEESELSEQQTFGMAMSQDKTIDVPGQKRGEMYSHAVFEFKELEDGNAVLAAAQEQADVLDEYLDAYFKKAGGDHSDESAPVEEKYEKADVAKDDDDLPF